MTTRIKTIEVLETAKEPSSSYKYNDYLLFELVGDVIPDDVFGQLEYLDTPVEETGHFSCISRMRTPAGREIMVLEENSGNKRLSWW